MLIIEMKATLLTNMMLIMINEDDNKMVNIHIDLIMLFQYYIFHLYLIIQDVHVIYNVLN
jgi:hypothetical protein